MKVKNKPKAELDPILRLHKAKALIIKTIYPSKYYVSFFLVYFPEYNDPKKIQLINQVWNFKQIDLDVIDKLERLPALIKP
jgi:hypothetical protein